MLLNLKTTVVHHHCRRRPGNIIRPPVFSRFICCRDKKIYVVVHICHSRGCDICRGGGTDFV